MKKDILNWIKDLEFDHKNILKYNLRLNFRKKYLNEPI